jgi:WD40 repeat protein
VGCWQIDHPRPLWLIRAHKSEVTSVAFSSDGRRGLSTGDDGTVFLWEIDQGRSQQLFNEYLDANKTTQWPSAAFGGFLDDNTLLVIRAGAIKHEISTGRELWRNFEISKLVGRRHQRYMDFSSQAGVIAVGDASPLFDSQEQIEIYDAKQGGRLSMLKCPAPISRLALTWDAGKLLAADSQGRLTVYESRSGRQIASARTEPFFGLCRTYIEQAFFAFDRLGKLHKISMDHEFQMESRDSLDLVRLGPAPSVITCLPNNQTLVMGTNTGTLLLIDWKSARVLRKWESGKSLLSGSIFPNKKGAVGIRGSHIAGQPKAGYKMAFLERSGKLVDIPDSPHTQRISGVAAIDSQRALTVDKGGTAVIWKGQRAIKVHRGKVDFTSCAAWCDAGLAAGGTQDDKVVILGEGEQVKEFSLSGGPYKESGIAALAITGKPMSIFAVYFSGAVRFNQEHTRWWTQGHNLMGSAAALAPGSQLAASGNINGEVRLWNCSNGDLAMEYFLHQGEVTALAFDSVGRFLYSAGADRFIYEINLTLKKVTRATVLPFLPIALLAEPGGRLSTLDLQGNIYRFLK